MCLQRSLRVEIPLSRGKDRSEIASYSTAKSIPRTVADVIGQHVTLELESLDRVYLNEYQPQLQSPPALFWFLRQCHGEGAVLVAQGGGHHRALNSRSAADA